MLGRMYNSKVLIILILTIGVIALHHVSIQVYALKLTSGSDVQQQSDGVTKQVGGEFSIIKKLIFCKFSPDSPGCEPQGTTIALGQLRIRLKPFKLKTKEKQIGTTSAPKTTTQETNFGELRKFSDASTTANSSSLVETKTSPTPTLNATLTERSTTRAASEVSEVPITTTTTTTTPFVTTTASTTTTPSTVSTPSNTTTASTTTTPSTLSTPSNTTTKSVVTTTTAKPLILYSIRPATEAPQNKSPVVLN